jgi:hypothetical protein
MDRIKRFEKQLRIVCKNAKTKKQREAVLHKCNGEIVKAIVDIVHNVLKGRIKIRNKNKLSKHKQQLRCVNQPGLSIAKRRQFLIQKGGFLPFLLPLIPLIAKAAAFAGPVIAKAALAGAAGTAVSAVANKIISK